MNRFNAYFTGVLLLFFSFVSAQTRLKGTIIDESNIPVPYADILLINGEGEIQPDRAISNEEGQFILISEARGTYQLQVISMGFTPYTSPAQQFTSTDRTVDMGTLKLVQEAYALEGVKLTGKKRAYLKKIDRTVIDLEEDSSTAGATILDVLERTPGLIVNRQNESIAMLGKNGVQVMINGKISYMPAAALVQFLNGINAENAKSIELITTPPAKLDAEGNAGYINIELKEGVNEGYNGNATSSLSLGDSKTIQNGGINFNVKAEKSSLVFNYSYTKNQLPYVLDFSRSLLENQTPQETQTDATRDNNRRVQNLRFSYNYQMSERVNFGTIVSGYSNAYRMSENKLVQIQSRGLTEDFYFTTEDNFWKNAQMGAFLTYQWSDDQQLEFSFDYLKYANDQPMDYSITLDRTGANQQLDLDSTKESPFNIFVYALDYEKTLGESTEFISGIKFVENDFRNTNELFRNNQRDPNFASDSQLDETVAAAYAQIKSDLSPQISMQAGLRYEHTQTQVNSLITNQKLVDRSYGNLFPSVYFGYKINDFNNLNISASRRINRPAFTDMAPFVWFVDLNQAFQGNVSLRPSYTNNLQLDYRFKSLNLSLQYTRETDGISRFQPQIDPNGFVTVIPDNIDFQNTFSAVLSYSFYPISVWNLRCFTTFSQTRLENNIDGNLYVNDNSNIRLNLNNDFTFEKGFSFQVWGFYQSKSVFGINMMKAMTSLNISLQKKHKNFTYTLNGSNLLDMQKYRFETKGVIDDYYQNIIFDAIPPQIKFSVAYSFGNQDIKKIKLKDKEEASRIEITP